MERPDEYREVLEMAQLALEELIWEQSLAGAQELHLRLIELARLPDFHEQPDAVRFRAYALMRNVAIESERIRAFLDEMGNKARRRAALLAAQAAAPPEDGMLH